MLIKSIKYCYDDVAIMPTVTSCVEHRKQCKPYDENGFLPIFTAPMSSVINSENFELFEKNNIYGILPRSEPYETRLNYCLNNKWSAFSLAEFKDLFCDEQLVDNYKNMPKKALIDVANGHMKVLFKIIKKAKELYGESLTIMMGNIANPETYLECAKCGVDYVRCSIGSGMGCFVKDTLITLSDGSKKNIQDIKEGDIVKTIYGENEVISTTCKIVDKTLKINNEIETTTNHKFLVINKNDVKNVNEENLMEYAFYIEASCLDKEKHLLVKND